MTDAAVEAACRAHVEHYAAGVDWRDLESDMRRALAAAYEADLNAMGEYANEVGGPVVGWLQKRIASLRQGGTNEKGRS